MSRGPGGLPRFFFAVVTGIALVGALLVTAAPSLPSTAAPGLHLPWWAMLAPFAIFQVTVLNVQVRREARSVSLSEIPVAVGLTFCTPSDFVVARIAGAVLIYLAIQKQYRQPPKLVFNTALALLESGLALVAFRLLAQRHSGYTGIGWAAVVGTNVVVSCTAALCVTLVIQLFDGGDSFWREARAAIGPSALQATVVSAFGLIAVVTLHADPYSVSILVVGGVAATLAYRAYARLNERHLSLERIYRFTQVTSNNREMSEVLVGVLSEAREMLHAEQALLTFLVPGEQGVEISLGRSGTLQRGPVTVLDADANSPVRDAVGGVRPSLVGRDASDDGQREWLAARRLREVLAVPLRGDSGAIAVLAVVDRLGEARGFDSEDARLLETVANHASIAIQNGRLVDQLRYESQHDVLTGLPNRAYFQRVVDDMLAGRAPEEMLVVGLLDLDNFKDVNDTLGHTAGDHLLCEVSQRLVSAGGPAVTVARLGGDEFAVAFATASTERALDIATALVASLHAPMWLGEVEVEVGGSLGIATTATSGGDRETLLKHADAAMYRAKHNTHDVALYEETGRAATADRLALVSKLRTAVEEDRIEVFAQPKVSLRTGRLVGVEALARWSDPERGHISPDVFIPLAERSGLVRPLTSNVLRTSIAACAGWQNELPGVSVAVNMSVKNLSEDALVDRVDFLLRRYKLDPGLLTLEITESTIMSDPARMLAILVRLTELGVRLSIDDFGTGYSSLAYLQRLPVQEVKIDRSFITDLSRDHDNAAIARSIIDLANALSLDVVAEGLETVDDWNYLRALDCSVGQGWLIGRPLPIDRLVEWQRAWVAPIDTSTAPGGGRPAGEAASHRSAGARRNGLHPVPPASPTAEPGTLATDADAVGAY